MLQFDTLSLLFIWWVVPIILLAGRGALAAHNARKRRHALRVLEESVTPFTRDL
jgi:hypothetical protein